jgi:hypothetical protein
LLLSLLLALTAGQAAAQFITFGKNKVQYERFRWQVLESSHFRLYFYPEEEELARMALEWAEESYAEIRRRFARDANQLIPLILYSSHQDFEQTNVTPYFLPEGVAGLTEFVRGRVLIPFNGSVPDFRETLQHELVHAFQLSALREAVEQRSHYVFVFPPLWFSEGLAVHWSEARDAQADMVLRDLVLSGRVPSLSEFWRYNGTFTLYKLGQSVLDFLAEEYGDHLLREFYERLGTTRSFEELFRAIYGQDQEEISRRWGYAVRRRYYPTIQEETPLDFQARWVPNMALELQPTPIPEDVPGWPHHYVFVSSVTGYANIYIGDLEGRNAPVEIVKGQRRAEFESFHAFSSRLDVSARGELVFASKHEARDVLFVYDLAQRRITDRFGFRDLVGISSPSWAPDGERIVFSGLARSGRRDLYIFDRRTRVLRRLTNDFYEDLAPQFHPSEDWIVFVSDRGPYGEEGGRNLFLMDLSTLEIRMLTCGPWEDLQPVWSPEGDEVLFVSSRSGSFEICTVDLRGKGARRTASLEDILSARWLPSGEILGTAYREQTLRTFRMALGEPVDTFDLRVPEPWGEWLVELEAYDSDLEPSRYRSRLTLDVAQGGVAVDPAFRSGEGLQAVLSDLMGDRLLLLQLGNTTLSTQDFLRNFAAGATYLDLGSRLNRGVSLYHVAGDYLDAEGLPFFERRVGLSLYLSYPFDRYHRVQTILSAAYSEKDWPSRDLYRRGMIVTHYLSFVRDNSLWLPTGPIDGERMHVTVGLLMNLERLAAENALALLDFRRYLRLGLRTAYAVRLQARISQGPDPQLFVLGGSRSLRGYDFRSLSGTRSILVNQELRFPLLRGLRLRFPFGDLDLPGVEGALFFDVGQAWEETLPDRLRGSYGLSFRMGLGGFLVLRLDMARRTDLHTWPRQTHTEFFVGWDY